MTWCTTTFGSTMSREAESYDARALIDAIVTKPLSEISLDLDGMQVRTVTVNGKRAVFFRRHNKLLVVPAAPLLAGSPFSVSVRYGGRPGLLLSHP